MPSSTTKTNAKIVTTQGQMWDHVSLSRLGSELSMQDVARRNVDNADLLEFPGELTLSVPETGSVTPVRQLPPWERM